MVSQSSLYRFLICPMAWMKIIQDRPYLRMVVSFCWKFGITPMFANSSRMKRTGTGSGNWFVFAACSYSVENIWEYIMLTRNE